MRYACLIMLAGCAGGTGTVDINGWGENAAIDGFAAADLADGWEVRFDHWVTSIANLRLSSPDDGSAVFEDSTNYLADWHAAPDPVALASAQVAEGRYDFGFDFVPATSGATNVNGAPGVDEMVANGWNTWVSGSASKGPVNVTFSWGMANPRRYGPCTNGADESAGIAVSTGATSEATIFVHTDHLLWDRLGTEEARLRFEALAGWADATGNIPLDDLARASTAAPTTRDGETIRDEQGNPLSYDDAGLGLSNLRDFVLYSTGRQGHLNGEGECAIADL